MKFNTILFILVLLIILFLFKENKENFMPWNIGTRYMPSYDIRGYPLLFPWNYRPYDFPFPYLTPYFYDINGKYQVNKKYANLVNKFYKDLLELNKSS